MSESITQVRDRLLQGWRFIVEATLAATVAWIVSAQLLDHPQPFFAPAAALLVLGAARGQRRVRAVEIVIGVAAGVLVADVVAALLGPGTTLTVFVVILCTSVTAVAAGASMLVLVQAMVSAVYVAVVSPPTSTLVPLRFIDALVGGITALVVTELVGPRDPVAPAVGDAAAVFDEGAGVLADAARALRSRDEATAVAALTRARAAGPTVDRLRESAEGARDSLWFTQGRTAKVQELDRLDAMTTQADYLVRNLRVLCRAVVGLIRQGGEIPDLLVQSVEGLATSLSRYAQALTAGAPATEVRDLTLEAVTVAGRSWPGGLALAHVTIVSQVRAAAIDLLRATGLDDRESIDRVETAIEA